MKYEPETLLKNIPEFLQLKKSKKTYSGPLGMYSNKTLGEFINLYENKGLKGKAVYDELIQLIAPEEYQDEQKGHEVRIKVKPIQPERYSMEELLTHDRRVLPYVSNMHQSVGKLMDIAINQAIMILRQYNSPVYQKYADVLSQYFNDHKSVKDIAVSVKDSDWNIKGNIIKKFMKGKEYLGGISISDDFRSRVADIIEPKLNQVCDATFEENDIDTPEKITFAIELVGGYDLLDDMKEWGNAKILIADSNMGTVKPHLTSLKKSICAAIVPVPLTRIIEASKTDFLSNLGNAGLVFDEQIIKTFADSHPWIEKDEDGNYYIQTRQLKDIYQCQGRIIYEEGGLIHHDKVKAIYESIYGKSYKTAGIQNLLRKRPENDFFPYGKTGQWYYSESGKQLVLPNKAISEFVEKHKCFYWKDIADVVKELLKLNTKLTKRGVRLEITNLCYVDQNNHDHFVMKGEEGKYPGFNWSKGRQTRINWLVNHTYEILNEAPGGKMLWAEFEKILKADILETGRPIKVIEDVKYKLSGSPSDTAKRLLFLRDKQYIWLNNDVIQNDYYGDLSMIGIYRKYPEYYDSIYSLAMSELRKRQDNKMQLTEFISLAIESLKSDEVSIDSPYIRKMFENNDSLPNGLSRYNDNGTVYIKLDIAVADEETKDEVQYDVTTTSAGSDEVMPSLVVSDTQRQPVTYATKFNWSEVKLALRKDLSFYDSPYWSEGITSDEVLDKFVHFISSSTNYNLNRVLPQTIYEFHYARIDRYDLNQYMLNLPIAFEALLRCINDSKKRSTYGRGISQMCEEWFPDYGRAIKYKEKKGFGKILNDMVHKRNLLLHGNSLELSPVTLVQNIVEYIALFVYTVNKYALDD